MIEGNHAVSKNAITVDQLKLACRHVEEMMAAGVTENLAIRTLELFADVYAKLHVIGNTSPHHVNQVSLWSIKARGIRNAMPDAKPKDHFRVEHGTPKRGFARKILVLYQRNELSTETLLDVIQRDYRLAVITLDEDQHLNRIARSRLFDTPEARWKAAGIEF
jgi:hypothetical protein